MNEWMGEYGISLGRFISWEGIDGYMIGRKKLLSEFDVCLRILMLQARDPLTWGGLLETRPLPYLPYRLKFQFPKKQLVHLFIFHFAFCNLSVLIAKCTKKISAPENTSTPTPSIPTLIAQVRSGQVSTSSSAHSPHLYREIIFTYRRQPRPRYGRSQKKKKKKEHE